MIRVAYYTQNPFNYCHPSFVTIDERTGRIFQSENTGKEYRFNMEDYLNEKYKNASPKFGSEICEVANPSLCGGFKTGLKVSFDDWLAGLDQANTWSEFPEQRAEFQKAYEALQAEEKKSNVKHLLRLKRLVWLTLAHGKPLSTGRVVPQAVAPLPRRLTWHFHP